MLAASFAGGIAVSGSSSVDALGLAAVCCVAAAAALFLASRSAGTLLIVLAFAFAGAAVHKVQETSITPDRIRSIYDSGEIVSILAITRDVTEARANQRALAEREVDLRSAVGRLADADRRKDEFIAFIV